MSSDSGRADDSTQVNILQEEVNPLPRSVRRSAPYAMLDGEWRFALDLEERGLGEMWYLGYDYAQTAPFPKAVELHLTNAKDAHRLAAARQNKIIAWYEREFTIPETWKEFAGSLIQVTFGACGYETRVWLNGHPLKTIEGEEIHLGEYNSFSYELPPEYVQ